MLPQRHPYAALLAATLIDASPMFEMDFSLALEEIGSGEIFRLANEARTNDSYLFARYLPVRNRPSYYAEAGNMTIRATMAGLVAIDGPLPDIGSLEDSKFNAGLAKIGGKVVLNEKLQREMQEHLIRTLALNGGTAGVTLEFMINEVLNFADKMLTQPMLDTEEYLRGQALVLGALDWRFADQHLEVDYGVPAANFLPARTGTDGYGGTTSKFWEDVVTIRRLLKRNVQTIVAHGDTIDMIIHNEANKLDVIGEDETSRTVTVRKFRGNLERPETSVQYTTTLTAYDEEGELHDLANRGKTITIPFMSRGKLTGIGRPGRRGYIVGEGGTPNPDAGNELGYTHLGPTVKGGGRLGRFARAYPPQDHPEQLIGEFEANVLPVITAEDKLATATTEMN